MFFFMMYSPAFPPKIVSPGSNCSFQHSVRVSVPVLVKSLQRTLLQDFIGATF